MFGSSATPIRFESLESRRQLAADFIASIVTPAANATLAVGVEHVAYITVTNAGTAMDRDTRVALNLYASTDGTLDTSTDLLLGTRTISRMNSGESETEDIEFVIPTGLAGGTQYRLFALVDPANQFAESNENNNTSEPVAVIFGSGSGGGGGRWWERCGSDGQPQCTHHDLALRQRSQALCERRQHGQQFHFRCGTGGDLHAGG